MKITSQKRLAAQLAGASPKRIKFTQDRLDDIKEAITKADIRGLINNKVIKVLPKRGVSRVRARKRQSQRRKGRQKGPGTLKSKSCARFDKKRKWINKIRSQRALLNALRTRKIVDNKTFRMLYMKSKGGFFRNKRHIKLYIKENDLILKKQ